VHRTIDEYCRRMADLAAQGAQAIILGYTEISPLGDQCDANVPLFDATSFMRGSAEWAMEQA
jgi:aspartate racemase